MRRTLLISSVSLLVLGGCSRFYVVETNVAETKSEVQKVKQQVSDLAKSVDDLNLKTGGATSTMRADLTIMLKELSAQIDRLGAELDESQYRLQQMEKKVDLMRSQKILISGPTDSLGLPKLVNGSDSGSAPSVRVIEALDIEKIYNQAREDFIVGKLELAISGFLKVFEKDVQETYRDNALFWVGESYFKLKNWEKAIEYYNRCIKEYPRGNKRCSAYFKSGLAFQELNQTESRNTAWKDLNTHCPTSNEAQRAQELMKSNP